jgi:hypothetical protein
VVGGLNLGLKHLGNRAYGFTVTGLGFRVQGFGV